mmetsp:Transcript_22637/g.40739  ORF Transcript_22637/g.40739 Transcript_22637/m.40739 type:complete len:237 (+) Transcript_22637:58-768(+)
MKRGSAKKGAKASTSTPTPARGKKPAGKSDAPKEVREPAKSAIDDFFDSYATPGANAITLEGLQRLCTDLGIDPSTDVAILVLIWKCETQQYGTITKDEFKRGMSRLSVDTITKLRSALPNMRQSVSNPVTSEFRVFYKFVFDISREGGAKVIDVEICIALLELLLANNFHLVPLFRDFLRQKGVRALNADQWTSFLEFAKLYDRDLSRYDDDGACKFYAGPLIFDEFVEWTRSRR